MFVAPDKVSVMTMEPITESASVALAVKLTGVLNGAVVTPVVGVVASVTVGAVFVLLTVKLTAVPGAAVLPPRLSYALAVIV